MQQIVLISFFCFYMFFVLLSKWKKKYVFFFQIIFEPLFILVSRFIVVGNRKKLKIPKKSDKTSNYFSWNYIGTPFRTRLHEYSIEFPKVEKKNHGLPLRKKSWLSRFSPRILFHSY